MVEITGGQKFKELPFGFNSVEDFVAVVNSYIDKKRIGLTSRLEGMEEMDERSRVILGRQVQGLQEELKALEERRKDPTAFYNQIKGIYETVTTLENQGVSQEEIGKRFLDDGLVDSVQPIKGFLESGLSQDWGYHLVQAVLAAKMVSANTRKA